jgi:hypothetical protein
MTPPSAASVISSSEAPTSSPVKLRAALALACQGTRVARAHACAAADEAAEVRGLGQRTLDARRGDLQRVALAQVGERQRDPLAKLQRDAFGMVDEHAQRATAENLG